MLKPVLLIASLASATFLAQDTVTVRVSGGSRPIPGYIVNGKTMVDVEDISQVLGAKVSNSKDATGKREVIWTNPSNNAKTFDDSPDTQIIVDGDNSTWQSVANSKASIRIRDFTFDNYSANGEMDILPQSIMVEGREPRERLELTFYVIFKDAEQKTLGRRLVKVDSISFDGGRYPISFSWYQVSNQKPRTILVRFNSAREMEAR